MTEHQVRMVAAGVVIGFWGDLPLTVQEVENLTDRMESLLRRELERFIAIEATQ